MSDYEICPLHGQIKDVCSACNDKQLQDMSRTVYLRLLRCTSTEQIDELLDSLDEYLTRDTLRRFAYACSDLAAEPRSR